MNAKRKDTAKEPSEVYETSSKIEANSEELHPVLVELLEKSKQDIKDGKGSTTEEVMKRISDKYPFLK